MTELAFIDKPITSTTPLSPKENIVPRKTIVYQTLMNSSTARIEGEKAKKKLFSRFLFKLKTPDEIEFVSIEKYYEPYIVTSGRHLIDYYRKCAYSLGVDKEVKEVILFGNVFTPRQASNSADNNIKLAGEERLVKETRAFLILNRHGQDLKLSEFAPAPSEDNPQKLIKAFEMPEIAPDMDLKVIRKRVVQLPPDVSRIVNEELEIDERSVIYTPRFRLTYKCPRLTKEASMEFDGVTLKQIKQNENIFSATITAFVSIPRRVYDAGQKWIMKKLNLR